jgi:F-type H+-transporting ATPase subunit alpha
LILAGKIDDAGEVLKKAAAELAPKFAK